MKSTDQIMDEIENLLLEANLDKELIKRLLDLIQEYGDERYFTGLTD